MPTRSRGHGTVVVLVTCPSKKAAEKLGHALIEGRLAACVNVISGLTSIYRWEGKTCQGTEVLLVIKSRRMRLLALARRVKALHPYSIPEVIALRIAGGSASYLAWVRDSTV
jgi:periplasmic divalent cation tolerance protein